jgi:hypothetical protein
MWNLFARGLLPLKIYFLTYLSVKLYYQISFPNLAVQLSLVGGA